ncbi:MAG TPA: DUF559 domain-containing protein [Sphingomicrobium sp.]|nr:DUF559 domain-containing protein [Sphingomicrobium sp.]
MKRIPERFTAHARELRNSATKAERLLWLRLRQYRPRFTRQLVVGPYILDLACRQARLAIELDGSQHAATLYYDERRTAFLEQEGWIVLRFWNNAVEENPDAVAQLILSTCARRLSGATHPQPSFPGRGGPGVHVFAKPDEWL